MVLRTILHSVSSLVQICLNTKLKRAVVWVLVRDPVYVTEQEQLLLLSQQQAAFLDRPFQVNKLCETHSFCSLSLGDPGAVSDMFCVRKKKLLGTSL